MRLRLRLWLSVRGGVRARLKQVVPLSLRVKDGHAAHAAVPAVVADLLHFFEVDSCGPNTLPLDFNRSK